MSDKALENAMARRDELAVAINAAQQRIEEWKRELARVDAFIAEWHRYADEPPPPDQDDYDLPDVPPPTSLDEYGSEPKKKRATGNPPKEEIAAKARDLIEARGRPVTRDQIFADLQNQGIEIKGTDPKMVLSTMLWRMKDQVTRLKGHGYWLPERPYEPAGYDPEIDEFVGVADHDEPAADSDAPDPSVSSGSPTGKRALDL